MAVRRSRLHVRVDEVVLTSSAGTSRVDEAVARRIVEHVAKQVAASPRTTDTIHVPPDLHAAGGNGRSGR